MYYMIYIFRKHFKIINKTFQRCQLPVDNCASVSRRVVQFPPTPAWPRAGRNVELVVHRSRDVQEKRQKQYSPSRNHHTAVSGNGTGKQNLESRKSKKNQC
jgi:hypothetical protein